MDRDPFIRPGGVKNRLVQFAGVDDEEVMLTEGITLPFYEICHISREEIIYLIQIVDMDRIFCRGFWIVCMGDIELVLI